MTSSLLPTYARYPLAFARGEGAWLETASGERYLDLGGGIAVASLGYSHPHLVEALTAQAGQLWHTSNLFEIPQAERLAQRLCAASFADYVFDEVQTGVGRTGRLFAGEHWGVNPDIMAVAKGIGGGFPLGAFLTTAEAGRGMVVGTHGTTYGGNPLATAVGNGVLDVVLAPGFIASVAAKGRRFKERLGTLVAKHPDVVAAVRGEGLMIGLKLRVPPPDFAAAARAARVLVIPAGDNVVRLLPPLVITEAEIDEGVVRLDAACREISAASHLQRGAAE